MDINKIVKNEHSIRKKNDYQLEFYGNVTCPYIMCELEENGNVS